MTDQTESKSEKRLDRRAARSADLSGQRGLDAAQSV
jgi:hypothetical protein